MRIGRGVVVLGCAGVDVMDPPPHTHTHLHVRGVTGKAPAAGEALVGWLEEQRFDAGSKQTSRSSPEKLSSPRTKCDRSGVCACHLRSKPKKGSEEKKFVLPHCEVSEWLSRDCFL